jgi:hypothetical protein
MKSWWMRLICCGLLLTCLTACGNQGAEVSTESQSSKAVEQTSHVERTKTLNTENRTTAMMTVPISPLIGEAWGELAQDEQPNGDDCSRFLTNFWLGERKLDNPEDTNDPALLTCILFLGHRFAFMPTIGWPVEPQTPNGRFYIVASLAHVLMVNDIASEIAANVATTPFHDVGEARARIKTLLAARKPMLINVYVLMGKLDKLAGTIDMTGKADSVAFSKGAYHLALGSGGAVLTFSGVEWFGKGNLSGKRYEMQVASMTGVAMNKASTITEGSEQKTEAGDKAQVGVGK